MNPRMHFKTVDPGLRGMLPYNYLPAAMDNIAGAPNASGRWLFPVRSAVSDGPNGREQAPSFMVDSATLGNPAALARMLESLRKAHPDAPVDRWFLGPPIKKARDAVQPIAAHQTNYIAGPRRVAAIVDGGIAFWDKAFRSGETSRFSEITYLDFDAPDGNYAPTQRLDRSQIKELCQVADMAGPNAVVATLADHFPGSFFGAGGKAVADQLWHGTAVADLMVGGVADDQDDVAVFGFELPMAVLRDHDGDSLLAVLTLTVEMILAATLLLKHVPLVIVLPFGFVSGPQDGSHPAVDALTQLLAQHDRKVDLVVPAGNHLQDRCVARFDAPSALVPHPARSVIWRAPPDDFSPNGMEIVRDGVGGTVDLLITPPGEDAMDVSLKEGDTVFLMRGDRPVGALIRRPDTATSARVRFAISGSGWNRADAIPAPAGDWQIAELGRQAVDIYALRDDRDIADDRGRPRWPATFADVHYRETDAFGAPLLVDDGASVLRRAGTASILTTVPDSMAVQANERLGDQVRQAWYSGNRADAMPWEWSVLVDDGGSLRGQDCAANGTAQRVRLSGTSAAAGLQARYLLGLSLRPQI